MKTLPPGIRLVRTNLLHIPGLTYAVWSGPLLRGYLVKQTLHPFSVDKNGDTWPCKGRPLSKPLWWWRAGPYAQAHGTYPTRAAALAALLGSDA